MSAAEDEVRATSTMWMQCTTPDCNNTPFRIKPQQALALVEFELARDPVATFKLPCDRCGRTTSYTRGAILRMLKPTQLARPLPRGQAWGFLLAEAPTAFDHRAFIGERILIEVAQTEEDGGWSGRTATTSVLSDSLQAGTFVVGRTTSGYMLIDAVTVAGEEFRIERVKLKTGVNGAIFFSPKSTGEFELKCDSIMCANPSCPTVFGMTYEQFCEELAASANSAPNEVTRFVASLECTRCGTFRVVTEDMFADISRAYNAPHSEPERVSPTSFSRSARALLPILGACTQAAAELFERAMSEAEPVTSYVPRDDLYVDAAIVVLHLVDRLSFGRYGVGGRMVFMNAVLTEMSKSIPEDFLRERYNAAQAQFGACQRLFAEDGEPLAGTLYWEIARDLARRHGITNPGTIGGLAIAAGYVGSSVERAYKDAEIRAK